jgi:hypothetical protein
MKRARFAVAVLGLAALFAPSMRAQDKPAENKIAPTTLKLQVTISEYEGEKKVANLPYTFFVQAADAGPNSPWTKVRMASRVPIATGKEGNMQYLEVGTNIDARGFADGNGHFTVMINLERSWIEGDDALATAKVPLIRQFKTELTLPIKDGQTVQTTQAADPLSARVLTIVATMNLVK